MRLAAPAQDGTRLLGDVRKTLSIQMVGKLKATRPGLPR